MPIDLTPTARVTVKSPTLAGNETIQQRRSEGMKLYHLGFGESRFPVHPKILAALRQHAAERSYPPVRGIPELRETIAGFYRRAFDLDVAPEQVIAGPGSKSLIFALIQVLDGSLLLPRPSWVSYEPLARIANKPVTWIDTAIEEEYCLTAERLTAGIAEARRAGRNPRFLVLNNPTNPTGVVYPEQTLQGLATVAREHDLTVISDEIYALVNHGTRPHRSLATYYPEGTVITGGLSKHLSLGGWRFGLAVVPPGEAGGRLVQAMAALASEIWSSIAAPIQHAAVVAYRDDPEIRDYVKTCAAIHAAVTRALYDQLREAGIPCAPPSGGFYLYPNFNPWRSALERQCDVTTPEGLAELLLEEHSIATLPGTAFGGRPDDLSLRLATSYLYSADETQVQEVMAAYAETPDPEQFVRRACPEVLEVGQRFRTLVESLSS